MCTETTLLVVALIFFLLLLLSFNFFNEFLFEVKVISFPPLHKCAPFVYLFIYCVSAKAYVLQLKSNLWPILLKSNIRLHVMRCVSCAFYSSLFHSKHFNVQWLTYLHYNYIRCLFSSWYVIWNWCEFTIPHTP